MKILCYLKKTKSNQNLNLPFIWLKIHLKDVSNRTTEVQLRPFLAAYRRKEGRKKLEYCFPTFKLLLGICWTQFHLSSNLNTVVMCANTYHPAPWNQHVIGSCSEDTQNRHSSRCAILLIKHIKC